MTCSRPSTHWLWPPLLLLGAGVVILAWATLSANTGRPLGAMALLAALESVWMLRLGGLRNRRLRIMLAVAATVTITVVANVFTTAWITGAQMGVGLIDALDRTGMTLAWTYSLMRNGLTEWILLGVAMLLAWRLAR